MTLTMRTIKIALATVISIWLADLFQLESSLSAGIIAILSVLDTKKASVGTAVERFLSTLLALSIAAVLFFFFGYGVAIFGVYLLLYVPLAYRFGLQSGIAPCSVLVTHLMLAESVAASLLLNEVLLMAIGAGVAIMFNLYMPNQEEELEQRLENIEDEMKNVLKSFDASLTEGERPEEMTETFNRLETKLNQAQRLALQEYDNQLFQKSDYYVRYFLMRQEQSTLLQQMSQNLTHIQITTRESKILGGLFYLTADQLHELNTGEYLLRDVELLHDHFRESSLPQSREEFESRAILFQLMLDFKQFLLIKRKFALEVQTTPSLAMKWHST